MPRRKPGEPPKRRGPKARELTAKEIKQIENLAGFGLTNGQIATIIGLGTRSLERKKATDAQVKDAIEAGRAKVQAEVAKALVKKAKQGDVQAIRWYEATRAGRSEKQSFEHSGPNGGPIEVSDARSRLAERLARAQRKTDPGGAG